MSIYESRYTVNNLWSLPDPVPPASCRSVPEEDGNTTAQQKVLPELEIDFDADQCARELSVHVFPPTQSALARYRLATILKKRWSHYTSVWICCAWSPSAVEASLLDLADAMDNGAKLATHTREPVKGLRRLYELQPNWGISGVFIFVGATTEVITDALSRFMPSWGVHLVVIPGDCPISVEEVKALCPRTTEVPHVPTSSTREDIDWVIAEKKRLKEMQRKKRLRREQRRRTSVSPGANLALEVMRSPALSVLGNPSVDSPHSASASYSPTPESMSPPPAGHLLAVPTLEGSSRARLSVASTMAPESISLSDDDEEERIDLGWILRCCDRCLDPMGCVQFISELIHIADVDAIQVKQMVDQEMLALARRQGNHCTTDNRGSITTTEEPHVPTYGPSATLRCFSTALANAGKHSTRDVLWSFLVLPPCFPSVILDVDELNLMVRSRLVSVIGSGEQQLVLVEDWVRQALDRFPHNDWLTEGTEATVKRIQALDEFVRDHGLDVDSPEALWVQRWREAVVTYFISQVRRRCLYFPNIASLLSPQRLADVAEAVAKAKPPEHRTLPEDHKQWLQRTATSSLLKPMVDRAEFLKKAAMYRESARQLEEASAICCASILSSPDGGELMTCCLSLMYLEISELYIQCHVAGLGAVAADRAAAMTNALGGSRRDTPCRAVTYIIEGWKHVKLSEGESLRADACRRSAALTSASASDMLLKTIVRADVEHADYLRKARSKLLEASTALQGTPASLCGPERSLCNAAVSAAMTAEHNDKEALRYATAALEAEQCSRRADRTTISRPLTESCLTTRDTIVWARANVRRFVGIIAAGDYDQATEMLVECPMLAIVGYVDGDEDAQIFSDSMDWHEVVEEHTFPTPKSYEHIHVQTCYTDLQLAEHHGMSWKKKPKEYHFAALELLLTMGETDAKGIALLDTLLNKGMNPNTCSPHDMRTLLHIAVDREIAIAVSCLIRHAGVVVDGSPPYRLASQRTGLSTVAKVTRAPNTQESPLQNCKNTSILMQLVLECADPVAVFERNVLAIVERLSVEDDKLLHRGGEEGKEGSPTSAKESKSPRGPFSINTLSGFEFGGAHQELTRLGELFVEGCPFHDEVPKILCNDELSSISRERLAWYCDPTEARAVLKDITDPPTAVALTTICHRENPSMDLVAAIATEFIRNDRYEVAKCVMDQFDLHSDFLFWEDGLKYRSMENAKKKAEEELHVEEQKRQSLAPVRKSIRY